MHALEDLRFSLHIRKLEQRPHCSAWKLCHGKNLHMKAQDAHRGERGIDNESEQLGHLLNGLRLCGDLLKASLPKFWGPSCPPLAGQRQQQQPPRAASCCLSDTQHTLGAGKFVPRTRVPHSCETYPWLPRPKILDNFHVSLHLGLHPDLWLPVFLPAAAAAAAKWSACDFPSCWAAGTVSNCSCMSDHSPICIHVLSRGQKSVSHSVKQQ